MELFLSSLVLVISPTDIALGMGPGVPKVGSTEPQPHLLFLEVAPWVNKFEKRLALYPLLGQSQCTLVC